MIGLVGLSGGAIMGLTGGLAAPFVAAGAGAIIGKTMNLLFADLLRACVFKSSNALLLLTKLSFQNWYNKLKPLIN